MSNRPAFLSAALSALLASAPGPTHAAVPANDPRTAEQIHTFATCAGRMRALSDHLSLFGGGARIDRAEAARHQHGAVLEALLEIARAAGFDDGRATTWRVEGLAAQRAVLRQSVFGTSEETRTRAKRAAARHIAACDRLILGT